MTENATDGAREVRPFSFGDDDDNIDFDFRPRPVIPEADDALDPKVSSAPESAGSSFPPDLIPQESTEPSSTQEPLVGLAAVGKDSGPPKPVESSTRTSSVKTKTG